MNDRDFTKCSRCSNTEFLVEDKVLICKICKTFIMKISSASGKISNKSIHLTNVLKSYENENLEETDMIFNKLLEVIEAENLDKKYVTMDYICRFLKRLSINNYILNTRLYKRFHNKTFFLTDKIKEDIKTVFIGYNSYLTKYKKEFSESTSLSYPLLLHRIIKTLDIEIEMELSASKTENEMLNKTFDNFLNYLCKKHSNKNEGNVMFCYPDIENIEVNVYDYYLINRV